MRRELHARRDELHVMRGGLRARRGQADYMPEWFPRMLLVIVAVAVIVMIVRTYTDRDVDPSGLQRDAYLYRLYYDDIIMYQDNATERVYPGVVDMQKLDAGRLDRIFVEREPSSGVAAIASRITAAPAGGCPFGERTVYNNEPTFRKIFAFSGSPGMGSTATASFPVTLVDRNAECAGVLNITIARPPT